MKNRFFTCFIILFSVMLITGAGVFGQEPGPALDRLYFRSFDVDRAPRDMEAGRMDFYLYSLKTEAAGALASEPGIDLFNAPASTVSLLLNPAPAPRGELNPFSIPEIRQAMQFLIDREFIARDIYQGMAMPMRSHVSPEDYDYLTVYDIDRGSGIAYDPEYGRDLINEAMTGAGARIEGGKWYYQGRPVRIKLIGRVEDERRNIADLVRNELEKAGFTVAISYRSFAAAVLSVYSSDPAAFEWHIYTEGWGRSAAQRYDYSQVNQMSAPWLGNMPGWQEVGFWQYEQPELDRLGKQLFRGEFGSLEERNRIYREMTDIALDESVRIWLATVVNSFPGSAALKGVTQDIVGGPRSPWMFRETYIPGKRELTVGHLWVWTERTVWNPVGGFGDVYSVDIWRNIHDAPIWNHPFTGIPMPLRADYDVETAGPRSKLPVPADAQRWNVNSDRWEPVGNGMSAKSRVIFDYSKYFSASWHHGEDISMADVVYSIMQSYELAYDRDKSRIEVALGVTARPYLETFKGYRILDENRLEVYLDYWHFEENYIASYASPAGLGMPWELMAAMDDLVFNQRRAAYSDTAAARFNVTWLNLVMDRDARLVDRTLSRFSLQKSLPSGVFDFGGSKLVDSEEAVSRYRAAMKWFDDTGHLVISNGPYYLYRYDPPAQFAELRAYRDTDYPFSAGDFAFGLPPELSIAGIGKITLDPAETAKISVTVNGPGRTGLRYLLLDPVVGEVVAEGEAEKSGSRFTIRIDKDTIGSLFPGLYRLSVAAYSDAVATVSERSIDAEVLP